MTLYVPGESEEDTDIGDHMDGSTTLSRFLDDLRMTNGWENKEPSKCDWPMS